MSTHLLHEKPTDNIQLRGSLRTSHVKRRWQRAAMRAMRLASTLAMRAVCGRNVAVFIPRVDTG